MNLQAQRVSAEFALSTLNDMINEIIAESEVPKQPLVQYADGGMGQWGPLVPQSIDALLTGVTTYRSEDFWRLSPRTIVRRVQKMLRRRSREKYWRNRR